MKMGPFLIVLTLACLLAYFAGRLTAEHCAMRAFVARMEAKYGG